MKPENGDSELKIASKIYSIKHITKNKTELQITDIIRNELELKDDDLYIWNRMLMDIQPLYSKFRKTLKGCFLETKLDL